MGRASRGGGVDPYVSDFTEFDIDGHIDAKGIRYIGRATKMPDGTWRCLADVLGRLRCVEIYITFPTASALARIEQALGESP